MYHMKCIEETNRSFAFNPFILVGKWHQPEEEERCSRSISSGKCRCEVALLAVLTVAVAACDSEPEKAPDPLIVGHLNALTGSLSYFGESHSNSIGLGGGPHQPCWRYPGRLRGLGSPRHRSESGPGRVRG